MFRHKLGEAQFFFSAATDNAICGRRLREVVRNGCFTTLAAGGDKDSCVVSEIVRLKR